MDPDRLFLRNAKRRFYCQNIVITLSFIDLFAGIMDVTIGLAAHNQLLGMLQFIEIDTSSLIMVAIVGVACLLLFVLGCKAANSDTVSLLVVHSICTFNIFLISIVMTVLCIITRNGVEEAPTHFDVLITAFQNYKKNETFIDDIQEKYRCCGPNHLGYKYWNDSIPASCYKDHDSILVSIRWTVSILQEHGVEKVSDIIYADGCTEEFFKILKDLLLYISFMNYISVIALAIGFICSVTLCLLKIEEYSIRPEPVAVPEHMPQPFTVPVDLSPTYHECEDFPPSYLEAVAALQMMETDFLRVPECIEMNVLPTDPPAYEDIDFGS